MTASHCPFNHFNCPRDRRGLLCSGLKVYKIVYLTEFHWIYQLSFTLWLPLSSSSSLLLLLLLSYCASMLSVRTMFWQKQQNTHRAHFQIKQGKSKFSKKLADTRMTARSFIWWDQQKFEHKTDSVKKNNLMMNSVQTCPICLSMICVSATNSTFSFFVYFFYTLTDLSINWLIYSSRL